MKKILVLAYLFLLLFTPKTALAQQYGQGTVLGAEDEVTHAPIEAGLAENLAFVSFIMLGSSFLAYKRSKRTSASVRIN